LVKNTPFFIGVKLLFSETWTDYLIDILGNPHPSLFLEKGEGVLLRRTYIEELLDAPALLQKCGVTRTVGTRHGVSLQLNMI
jgi:hypothetical protein